MDKEDVKQVGSEKITLEKRELWLLKIAAATGVMSFISHGISAVTYLLNHL